MTHTSGKNSSFAINSVSYDGKGWTVDPQGQEVRTDNTADNGYSNRIISMKDIKATLEFEFDVSANLMDTTPTLQIGTVLTGVKLFLDESGSSSVYWSLPSAIVLSTPMQAKVGDAIKWTVTIGNKGAFAPPTGTFAPSAFGA